MHVNGEHRSLVLLGAGASQEAGIPTTFELTRVLVERIEGHAGWRRDNSSALNFVCGTLVGYDAATKGTSPFDRLDIERVFAAVELLAERRDLEVTPFVASWLPAVDAWDQSRSSGLGFFDQNLAKALMENPGFNNARDLITSLIREVTRAEGTGEIYANLARRMLDVLRELVAVTEKQIAYLTPLVEQGQQECGLTIATLNYDLAVEGAAEARDVPARTGIREWIDNGRWEWPTKGIRLLKLHGSIDWAWQELRAGDGDLPRKVVKALDSPSEPAGDPVLVFGARGKLRAEGPFLGLLAEFEKQLSDATRLIVIGYSFRDDHVNELITRWMAEGKARTILAVDPGWPSGRGGYKVEDFRIQLNRHVIPPEHRPEAFEPRLRIWRTTCGAALEELGRLGFNSELPDVSADEASTGETAS